MTFLGWLSDPFKGLSDLQQGDEKGTLNHLVEVTLLWDPTDMMAVFSQVCLFPRFFLPDFLETQVFGRFFPTRFFRMFAGRCTSEP